MKRRNYICSIGTIGIGSVVSGCLGDSSDDEPIDETLDVPEEVEAGALLGFEITVENTGDEEVVYDPDLEVRYHGYVAEERQRIGGEWIEFDYEIDDDREIIESGGEEIFYPIFNTPITP